MGYESGLAITAAGGLESQPKLQQIHHKRSTMPTYSQCGTFSLTMPMKIPTPELGSPQRWVATERPRGEEEFLTELKKVNFPCAASLQKLEHVPFPVLERRDFHNQSTKGLDRGKLGDCDTNVGAMKMIQDAFDYAKNFNLDEKLNAFFTNSYEIIYESFNGPASTPAKQQQIIHEEYRYPSKYTATNIDLDFSASREGTAKERHTAYDGSIEGTIGSFLQLIGILDVSQGRQESSRAKDESHTSCPCPHQRTIPKKSTETSSPRHVTSLYDYEMAYRSPIQEDLKFSKHQSKHLHTERDSLDSCIAEFNFYISYLAKFALELFNGLLAENRPGVDASSGHGAEQGLPVSAVETFEEWKKLCYDISGINTQEESYPPYILVPCVKTRPRSDV